MGLKRSCQEYKSVKGGVKRCKRFAPAAKAGIHPKCGSVKPKNMRSPGLIRKSGACHGGPRKARRSEKKRR